MARIEEKWLSDAVKAKLAIDIQGTATLTNNQTTAANITGLVLNKAISERVKIDYTISRKHVATETIYSNAVDTPHFNNSIRKVVVQPDGKILIGGDFTSYPGATNLNRFIRLNVDGTLDSAFVTNASDNSAFSASVQAIALQSDGKILVGGSFSNYNGTTNRNRLVRLNADGTTDTAFCTNAVDGSKFNNQLTAIAVQADGKILVGGYFLDYAGTTGRSWLIRLFQDGTLDTDFCTTASDGNVNQWVWAITVQSDGKILLGGDFTNYKTTNRNRLVRLNSDGSLDTTFSDNAAGGSKINSTVKSIQQQADGKILVAGYFFNYGGTSQRSWLLRLKDDGTLDTDFMTVAVDGNKMNFQIESISLTPYKIYLGGGFINVRGVTGRDRLFKMNYDGSLDNSGFLTNGVDSSKIANGSTLSVAVQSDGMVLAGGTFNTYGGTTNRNKLIRLSPNGNIEYPALKQESGTLYAHYNQYEDVWELGAQTEFAESGVSFSIDQTSGQIKYISSNLSGTASESIIKYYGKYL
jgi:uncharacterized delta-60 repeat protein